MTAEMIHTLVVGLGAETKPFLDDIQANFDRHERTDRLNVLLCAPQSVDRDDPHHCDLSLNKDAFNTLYFSTESRKWSAANWQQWGEALRSNRVTGKLAMHYHMTTLYDDILQRINALSKDGTQRVHLYVVAHLHEPFASGALLDMAYLLYHIGRTRPSRVYGCCLLPGMEGDTLMQERDDHDTRMFFATAYAALRELAFILGSETFFDNHHADIRIESSLSPFQSGDCYLIGGEQADPFAPLRYKDVRNTLSEWIYLQSATTFTDQIPHSLGNTGVVSSIGWVPSARGWLNRQDSTRQQIIDYTRLRIAEMLLRAEGNTQQPDRRSIERWLSWTASTAYTPTDTLAASDDNAARDASEQVARLDAELSAELNALRNHEANCVREGQRAVVQYKATLHAALDKLRASKGLTLLQFEQILEDWRSKLSRAQQRSAARLQAAVDEAEIQLDALHKARVEWFYNSRVAYSRLALAFIWQVTIMLVAGPLLITGLVIQAILWVLIAEASLAPIFYLAGRRRRLALNRYQGLLRTFLRTQQVIVEQRSLNVYHTQIQQTLEAAITTSDGGDTITHLRDYLNQQANAVSQPRRNRDAEIVLDYETLAQQALQGLWATATDTGLDANLLTEIVDEAVVNTPLLENQQSEADAFQMSLEATLPNLYTTLAINRNLIPQDYQTDITTLAGQINWQGLESDAAVRQMLQTLGVSSLHDLGESYRPTQKRISISQFGDAPQPLDEQAYIVRQVVLLRVRNNVPLAALLSIDRWRQAYLSLCRREEPDRNLTLRQYFHPTRVGVAAPDVVTGPGASFGDYAPMVVMALVALLHQLNKTSLVERLADALRVNYPSGINYDELCGALNAEPSRLEQLLAEAQEQFDQVYPDTTHDVIADLKKDLRDMPPPIHSERYADWEVWVLQRLDKLVTVRTSADAEIANRIAIVYWYFKEHNPLQ